MARGITEKEVHSAADALVCAGERPTVERIRAHLGTGSPNTVIRWLDTWWAGLGTRLRGRDIQIDLPQAPGPVAELAGQFWAYALEHARALAEDALAQEQVALQTDRVKLDEAREELHREAARTQEQVTAALQARDLAVARSEELERLVRRLEEHLEESKALLAAADGRAKAAEERHRVLEQRHQDLQERSETERRNAASHVRATEDRASVEVDRARQEARDLKRQLATVLKEHGAEKAQLHSHIDEARQKANDALQEAAAQRARAEALHNQLASLQDLPAALETVLQQAARRQKSGGDLKPGASGRRKAGSMGKKRSGGSPSTAMD